MNVIKSDLKKICSSLYTREINRFKGKSIFISGASGFLGRWFRSFFDHLNDSVFVNSADKCSVFAVDVEDLDITNPDFQDMDIGPFDFYINSAGIASPKWYKKQPFKTIDVSYTGTVNVFERALRENAESVLVFSSSEVYGDPPAEHIPTPETYTGQIPTMGSRSCYDVGKLVIETLSDIFHQERDLPVKIIRPFNLYGPYMRLDDGRMMANLCKSVVENDIMSVYGTGNQTRTYCYVADAILLMIKALLSDENGEVFNVGSNYDEMSALEVCETAYDILGANKDNLRVIEHPSFYPKDEPNRRKADISKVINAFGNEPKTPFTEGIKRTYQYVEDVYRNSRENFGGEIR